ncbi:hypothetical protein NKR23_g9452 [Pleurostoma richardsiae]|uniref:F-box domain-containing protein n=1 Tax=Pleurostoma richardsiae TaxID=41990 RepID=A0AA38RFD9_9PEZI|nr:hypothetical protein NKR23_g9452 [Pleurostoma richardsiae]
MPANLCSLPPELVIAIMHKLPDLVTLYNFYWASPCIRRLFRTDSASIIESVVRRSLPPEMWRMILMEELERLKGTPQGVDGSRRSKQRLQRLSWRRYLLRHRARLEHEVSQGG